MQTFRDLVDEHGLVGALGNIVVGARRSVVERVLKPSPFWDLIKPLDDDDFLVGGERIWWKQRYHSAILLRPAFDLIAALTLVVWFQLNIGLTRTRWAAALAVLAAWIMGRLIVRVHRTNRRSMVIFATLVLVALALASDRDRLALLIVVGFAMRFFLRWLRWRFYRRLIVTGRRVMQIDGLLGNTIATMPLFRITDTLSETTVTSELLGYSRFRIESAGQDQALGRINFLPDGDRFQRLVAELATTPKSAVPVHADPYYKAIAKELDVVIAEQADDDASAELDRSL